LLVTHRHSQICVVVVDRGDNWPVFRARFNLGHKNANHPIVGRGFDWAAHDLFRAPCRDLHFFNLAHIFWSHDDHIQPEKLHARPSRVKVRVVVDFNAAILLRLRLVIHGLVNLDFRAVLQQELEVPPELVLVPDTLRHDVRHFVQRDEHERVGVNELAALLRGVQAERQLLALVLAVRGELAGGQRFADLLRVKICDQAPHVGLVGVRCFHVRHQFLHVHGALRQQVRRHDQLGAFAHAVLVAVHVGHHALELEGVRILVHAHANDGNERNQNIA